MLLPTPAMMGAIFGGSEFLLSVFKRSPGTATSADRGSLQVLWLTIGFSIGSAIYASRAVPQFSFVPSALLYSGSTVFFFAGLALRWLSIVYLGRFFTVDVAIASDHKVIDSGPYRYIRHPAYAGALMAFLGFGSSLGNGLSMFLIAVPVTLAFMHRMSVEEAALRSALGEPYESYMRRSKRLIPFIY